MQKVTVRTEGRKVQQHKFGINTSVARLCLSVAEEREGFEACRKERKGGRLCPEDGRDAGRISKTRDTDVFKRI